MPDDSAELLMKAEACQLLADLSPETPRRAYWNEQADYWYELAAKVAKRLQQRKSREIACSAQVSRRCGRARKKRHPRGCIFTAGSF
jgi:hypothetical protein